MSGHRQSDRSVGLRAFSAIAAGLVGALGIAVLAGWAFDVPLLKSAGAGLVTMKANTAMGFLLAGAALWLLQEGRPARGMRGTGLVCAAAMAVIGALTLLEYVSRLDFGIDQLLFQEPPRPVRTSHPGRMAPNTALSFLLLGLALLCLDRRTWRGLRPADALIAAAGLIALLATVGYVFGVGEFLGVGSYTSMSVHAAAGFLLAVAAAWAARPDAGLMSLLSGDRPANVLARRLLPAVILLPLLLGYGHLVGENLGWHDHSFGTGLLVVLMIVTLGGLTLLSAVAIERADAGRVRAEAETARFFGMSLDMLGIAGTDGWFKRVNPAFTETLGYATDELLGRPFLDLVHPDDLAATLGAVERLAAGQPVIHFDNRYRCKDGSWRWLSWRSAPAPGGLIYATARDVTDRKRAEERLERLNAELTELARRAEAATRAKSDFLASMSHELRTPLNAIIGFSELIHDGKLGPVSPEHKEFLGDVLSSARHLLHLINDMLDLAKVESGRMEFHPEPVDLASLVAESRDMLRELSARKRIAIETEVAPALSGIVVDPARLKQVVYNYLSNALKFTAEGGRVAIRVRAEGEGSFRVQVEDTGPGIAPGDVPRLFREFEQVGGDLVKRAQGTGLGLAVTKRLVESQGGRVGVDSEAGRGSVFWAVLPRLAQTAAEPSPLSRPEGGPAVLVVEDDAAERAFLSSTLAAAGYAVETAASGEQAVALCRKRSYDAITLDLILPDTSGWDVLRAIRADGPSRDAAVVVVTLVAEGGAVVFPIADYLVKPVDPEDLLAALRRAGVVPGSRPVLVVDDDTAALRLADAALSAAGYRVAACADAPTGLRRAAEDPPGAVLLDLLMPGMDGFEFLDRFRRTVTGARTPVIVWTNKDLTAAERARLADAAQGIVAKAERFESVIEQLRACLRPKGGGPPESVR